MTGGCFLCERSDFVNGFKDIIGHEQVIGYLQTALKNHKVSNAYMICGEPGSGKTLVASAFAKALVCQAGYGDACNMCDSCHQFDSGSHPDIRYVSHEKPDIISVDEIREQVDRDVIIKPYSSKYKIYIIDEAEKLPERSQNALLKTIEEPPDFVTILILTTNKEKLLPTVLSRCVCLDVMPVKKSVIKSYLMDKGIVDYQADMAINFAEGNPGKALMIASDVEFQNRRKLIINTIRDFDAFNSKRIADMAKKIEEDKDNIDSYFDLIMVFLRDVLVYKTTGDEKRVHFREEISVIRDISRHKLRQINELINITKDARDKVNAQVTLGLTIEMMLHKMKETV